MQRLLVLPSLLILAFGLAQPLGAADKSDNDPMGLTIDSEYFPLKIGTTWTYRETTSNKTFVVRVVKYQDLTIKKDGRDTKVRCARLETTEQGKKDPIAIELVTVMDDGVHRCKVGDQLVDPPARILPVPLKKGDSWKIDSKVGGKSVKVEFAVDEEEITLTADSSKTSRKYPTMHLKSDDFKVDNEPIVAELWYAKGIGLVKLEMKVNNVSLVLAFLEMEDPEITKWLNNLGPLTPRCWWWR
jgi:hypothetical protein